jgi:hypothetical protein
MEDGSPELRQPCPDCGATTRALIGSAVMAATSGMYIKTRVLYRDGGPEVVRDVTEGDSYFRAAARWDQMFRLIDHGNNWYEEIFRDRETGEIIYRTAEPLTEHRHKPKP